jgi:CsoR family transcriptional regulator, copper-sensing transcriptional repressor
MRLGDLARHEAPSTLLLNGCDVVYSHHPTWGGVMKAAEPWHAQERRCPMRPESKREIEIGLKVAAGQLEGVRRMLGEDTYCVDLMKQLSAVQAQLERVNRALLKNHLSTCVAEAIRGGQGEQKIEELMQALKYSTGLTGVQPDLAGLAALGSADSCCPPAADQEQEDGHGYRR